MLGPPASQAGLSLAPRIKKTPAKVKIPGKGGLRWYKNVGLGFKTPKDAIEGACSSSSSSSTQPGEQRQQQRKELEQRAPSGCCQRAFGQANHAAGGNMGCLT